jgi:hypothetical protein
LPSSGDRPVDGVVDPPALQAFAQSEAVPKPLVAFAALPDAEPQAVTWEAKPS